MTEQTYNPSRAVGRVKIANNDQGFTLVEAMIALVILMVASLAICSLFLYAVHNNVGGGERALAMAVGQQYVEQLRSVNFNDATLAIGTTTTSPVSSGGHTYTVVKKIEDQTNADGSSKALKKITITVTPLTGGPQWVRTSVVLVSHRSTTAMGAYIAQ